MSLGGVRCARARNLFFGWKLKLLKRAVWLSTHKMDSYFFSVEFKTLWKAVTGFDTSPRACAIFDTLTTTFFFFAIAQLLVRAVARYVENTARQFSSTQNFDFFFRRKKKLFTFTTSNSFNSPLSFQRLRNGESSRTIDRTRRIRWFQLKTFHFVRFCSLSFAPLSSQSNQTTRAEEFRESRRGPLHVWTGIEDDLFSALCENEFYISAVSRTKLLPLNRT